MEFCQSEKVGTLNTYNDMYMFVLSRTLNCCVSFCFRLNCVVLRVAHDDCT